MADATAQLQQLRQSLEGFADSDSVPANLGNVFNALLAEAKQERPGDAVVAAVEPVGKTFADSEFADIDTKSMRALVDQLLTALQN